MITAFLKGILDLLYPEKIKCAFCGSQSNVGTAGLCGYCVSLLPYLTDSICIKCGRSMDDALENICGVCKSRKVYFDQGMVVFQFEGRVQDAIYRLKYNGEREMASVIGILMAEKCKYRGWSADIIVPVPLHPKRLDERGYNQSFLLSVEIGRELGIDVCDNVLIRKKDTVSQTQLTGLQRASNVRDAFMVKDRGSVKGKSVLLVDDIMTTGATLNECSKELKYCGADIVYCIAAACPVFNE